MFPTDIEHQLETPNPYDEQDQPDNVDPFPLRRRLIWGDQPVHEEQAHGHDRQVDVKNPGPGPIV